MVRVKPVQEPAKDAAPTLPLHPRFGCSAANRFIFVAVEQRIEELVDSYCYTAAVDFTLQSLRK